MQCGFNLEIIIILKILKNKYKVIETMSYHVEKAWSLVEEGGVAAVAFSALRRCSVC